MGVKDLWNILSPTSKKTSLYDLEGKTVAVDLSCWVCEGQSVGEKVITQPRMYLRNVFFRTCTLLMLNITPVFVLDGDAPAVKHDAMKQRNDARFKKYRDPSVDEDEQPIKESSRRKGGRSRFKGILKQCREMLELMGVCCVQSQGEAEALCAQLEKDGLVDGVITQDSDVFLYGARTVFRNLTIKLGSGTVDLYSMTDVEQKLHLDREKLVAMSILCGCDYDIAGVHGVGKEMAYKYLSMYRGPVLERLRKLKTDKTLERYEEEKNGCSKCCHPGKVSEHKRDGCGRCGQLRGCEENTSILAFKNLDDDEKKNIALELSLRRKAVQEPTFPNEDTIREFLYNRQTVGKISTKWKEPQIYKFVQFCVSMLEWETEYAFEKILPMTTRWLLSFSQILSLEELIPESILKKRVVKGVASYEIGWKVNDENLKSFLTILPEDCSCVASGLCVTTEPQVLILEKLPDMVAEFTERTAKKKPVKAKKEKKPKKGKNVDELSEAMGDLSIVKPKKVRAKKVKVLENSSEVLSEDYLENSLIFDSSYGKSSSDNCENIGFQSTLHDTSAEIQLGNVKSVFSRNLSPLKSVENTYNEGSLKPTKNLVENLDISNLNSTCSNSSIIGFVPPEDCFKKSLVQEKPYINNDISFDISHNLNSPCPNSSIIDLAPSPHDSFENSLLEEKPYIVPNDFVANFGISFDISNLSPCTNSPTRDVPSLRDTFNTTTILPSPNFKMDNSVTDDSECQNFYDTVVLSDDESTVEYDLSAIVEEIVSRKRF